MLRKLLAVWLVAVPCGAQMPEKAGRYFEALMDRPRSEGLFERFADAWRDERDGPELIEFLEGEAERTDAAGAWAVLARARQAAGDDAGALADFGKAVEREPEAGWLRLARAQSAWHLGQNELVIEEALRVAEDDALRLEAVALAGRAMLRARRVPEAVALWTAAVEAAPDDVHLLDDLAELCRREGQMEQAAGFAEKRLTAESDPLRREQARMELAGILMRSGKRDEAVARWSETLAASGAGSWLEREVLERAEEGLRGSGGAATWADQVGNWAAEHPGRTELLKRRVLVLAERAEWEEALAAAAEWLRRVPGDAEALWLRVKLLEGAGRPEEAWEALERLAAAKPDDPGLAGERIELASRHRMEARLKAALRRQAELAEDDAGRVAAGEAWLRHGFPEEAEALWRSLLTGEARLPAARVLARKLRAERRAEDEVALWRELATTGGWAETEAAVGGLMALGEHELAAEVLGAKEFGTAAEAELWVRLVRGDEGLVRQWIETWLDRTEEPGEIEKAVWSAASLWKSDSAGKIAELEALESPEVARLCLLAVLKAEGDPEAAVAGLAEVGPVGEEFVLEILVRHGRPDLAAERLAGRSVNPAGRAFHFKRLAGLWGAARRPEEELAAVRRWREAAPDRAEAWEAEARLLMDREPREAERLLRQALARLGPVDSLDRQLMQHLRSEGRQAEAFEMAWRNYLRADAAGKASWIDNLIRLSRETNSTEKLRERFVKLAEDEPTSALPVLALADLARQGYDRHTSEADHLREALRRQPGERSVRTRLAALHEKNGRGAAALAEWEELARLYPGPEMARELAKARLRNGDVARGLREWEMTEKPGGVDAREAAELAAGVALAGEVGAAIDFLRHRETDDDPWPGLLLACLLEWDGRELEAAAIYARMIDAAREAAAVGNFPEIGAHDMEARLIQLAMNGGTTPEVALAGRQELERKIQQLTYSVSSSSPANLEVMVSGHLLLLASRVGGDAWSLVERTLPDVRGDRPEDWRALAIAGSEGLVEAWRNRPSKPLARAMLNRRQANLLDDGEFERWLEMMEIDDPKQRLSLRINRARTAGGVDLEMLPMIEAAEVGTVEFSDIQQVVGEILRRVPFDRTDPELAERLSVLLDRHADEESHSRWLRVEIAAVAGDEARMWALLNAYADPRTADEPRYQIYSTGFSFDPEGRIRVGDRLIRTVRSPAELKRRFPRVLGDSSGDRFVSPVLGVWFSEAEPEEWLVQVEEAMVMADEEERQDLTILRWSRWLELDRGEEIAAEMEREVKDHPERRTAVFVMATELMEAVAAGAKDGDMDVIEKSLERFESSGVEMPEDLRTAVFHGLMQQVSSYSSVEPGPRLKALLAPIYRTPGATLRAYQTSAQVPANFPRPTVGRLIPEPRLDTSTLSILPDEERQSEAFEMLVRYLASPAIGQKEIVQAMKTAESLDVSTDGMFARFQMPEADAGLSEWRKWIRLAAGFAKWDEAQEAVERISGERPWDLAWQVERVLRVGEEAGLADLLENGAGFAAVLKARLADGESLPRGATLALAERLLDEVEPAADGPWLLPLLERFRAGWQARAGQQARSEEAEKWEEMMWRLALRAADRGLVSKSPELAFFMGSNPALASDKTLELVRRAWLVRVREERVSDAGQAFGSWPDQSLAWLVARARADGDGAVFSEEYLAGLAAADPDRGKWLERLLAAESATELPAPYAEPDEHLIAWLRPAEDPADPSDARTEMRSSSGMDALLERALDLPDNEPIAAALAARAWQSAPAARLVVAALAATEDFEGLAATVTRVPEGERQGLRETMHRQVLSAATVEPEVWGKLIRYFAHHKIVVAGGSTYSIPQQSDLTLLERLGLLGGVEDFVLLGHWEMDRSEASQQTKVWNASGMATHSQWISRIQRDDREEVVARIAEQATFGARVLATLLAAERAWGWLAEFDGEFADLDQAMVTATLTSLIGETEVELGPVGGGLIAARDAVWRDQSIRKLREAEEAWKSDDRERWKLAVNLMSDPDDWRRAPEALADALRAYAMRETEAPTGVQAGQIFARIRTVSPETLEVLLGLSREFPHFEKTIQSSQIRNYLWVNHLPPRSSAAELRATMEMVVEQAPDHLRRELLGQWLKLTLSRSWVGEGGGATAGDDDLTGLMLGCMRGWIANEDEGAAYVEWADHRIRALDRLYPAAEGSVEAWDFLVLPRFQGRQVDEKLIESIRVRCAALPPDERRARTLISWLQQHLPEVEADQDAQVFAPLVREVVAKGAWELSAGALLRLARSIGDAGIVELVLSRAGARGYEFREGLLYLLESGEVEAAERALAGWPTENWHEIAFGRSGSERLAAVRGKLDETTREGRFLAMAIDLCGRIERPATPGPPGRFDRRPAIHTVGPEWRKWWDEMNAKVPDDQGIARAAAHLLYAPLQPIDRPSPLMRAAYAGDPTAEAERLLAAEAGREMPAAVLHDFIRTIGAAMFQAAGGDDEALLDITRLAAGHEWSSFPNSMQVRMARYMIIQGFAELALRPGGLGEPLRKAALDWSAILEGGETTGGPGRFEPEYGWLLRRLGRGDNEAGEPRSPYLPAPRIRFPTYVVLDLQADDWRRSALAMLRVQLPDFDGADDWRSVRETLASASREKWVGGLFNDPVLLAAAPREFLVEVIEDRLFEKPTDAAWLAGWLEGERAVGRDVEALERAAKEIAAED